MKSVAFASALLAATVSANPTPTEEQPPSKRSSLPSVTASGNGRAPQLLHNMAYLLTSFLFNSILDRKYSILCSRYRLPAWRFVQLGRSVG